MNPARRPSDRPISRGTAPQSKLFRFVNDFQNRFLDRSRNIFNSRVRIEISKGRRPHGADERFAVFKIDSYGTWQHECHTYVLVENLVRITGIADFNELE